MPSEVEATRNTVSNEEAYRQVTQELINHMPPQGLIFHGVRAKHAPEKAKEGLKRESNSFYYLKKPTAEQLEDPEFMDHYHIEVRRMLVDLFEYGGGETRSAWGSRSREQRIAELSLGGVQNARDPQVFFKGKEGAQFLPRVVIAVPPQKVVDDFAEQSGVLHVGHARFYPVETSQFITITKLDYKDVQELDIPLRLGQKMIDSLEKSEDKSFKTAARRRLWQVGIIV